MTAPDDAEAVKEIDAIMARMDALVVSPVNACAYRDACRAQAKAIEALQADYDSMVENENRTARELAQADARIEALQAEVERLSAAPPAVGREEIARIVSPEAFEPLPHGNIVRGREAVALAKADAILSALGRTEAPTPPEGEG